VFLEVEFGEHTPPLVAEEGASVEDECYCKRTIRDMLGQLLPSLEKVYDISRSQAIQRAEKWIKYVKKVSKGGGGFNRIILVLVTGWRIGWCTKIKKNGNNQ
jgi:hypothetical protein